MEFWLSAPRSMAEDSDQLPDRSLPLMSTRSRSVTEMLGVGVGVGVGVRVGVGVAVGDGVGVTVGVGVLVGRGVGVRVATGVRVASGVLVTVGVAVAVLLLPDEGVSPHITQHDATIMFTLIKSATRAKVAGERRFRSGRFPRCFIVYIVPSIGNVAEPLTVRRRESSGSAREG
jgi:hypothetical protein